MEKNQNGFLPKKTGKSHPKTVLVFKYQNGNTGGHKD
jgi:hypothetical protein